MHPVTHLNTLRFFKWEDHGILLAPDIGTRADKEKSDYLQKSKELKVFHLNLSKDVNMKSLISKWYRFRL